MKTLFYFAVATALLVVSGCNQSESVDVEAEKANVKMVLDQFIQVMEQEDMELAEKIISHDKDMVSFGTDASERWVGWEAMKQSMEEQFGAFDGTDLTAKDQVIHVNSTGNTAWFSGLMDWYTTAMGNPVELNNARYTGVLEKRDGNWVLVQMHFSVPVQGQAAEY